MNYLIGIFNIILGFSVLDKTNAGIIGFINESDGVYVFAFICFVCGISGLTAMRGKGILFTGIPMFILFFISAMVYERTLTAMVIYGSAWMLPNVLCVKRTPTSNEKLLGYFSLRHVIGITIGLLATVAILKPNGSGLDLIYAIFSAFEYPNTIYQSILVVGAILYLSPIKMRFLMPYFLAIGIFIHIGTFLVVTIANGTWPLSVPLAYAFIMWLLAVREVNNDSDLIATSAI